MQGLEAGDCFNVTEGGEVGFLWRDVQRFGVGYVGGVNAVGGLGAHREVRALGGEEICRVI